MWQHLTSFLSVRREQEVLQNSVLVSWSSEAQTQRGHSVRPKGSQVN